MVALVLTDENVILASEIVSNMDEYISVCDKWNNRKVVLFNYYNKEKEMNLTIELGDIYVSEIKTILSGKDKMVKYRSVGDLDGDPNERIQLLENSVDFLMNSIQSFYNMNNKVNTIEEYFSK